MSKCCPDEDKDFEVCEGCSEEFELGELCFDCECCIDCCSCDFDLECECCGSDECWGDCEPEVEFEDEDL